METTGTILLPLLTMWIRPRMVAGFLVSTVFVLLGRLLFFPAQPVPYYVQFNPLIALVPVSGVAFGVAGAWGAALASLLADYLLGMHNRLSLFRVAGVFFSALCASMIWNRSTRMNNAGRLGLTFRFLLAALPGMALLPAWLGFGSEWLRLYPFPYVVSLELAQNVVFMPLIGIPLIWVLKRNNALGRSDGYAIGFINACILTAVSWCAVLAGMLLAWKLYGVAPFTAYVIGITNCPWVVTAVFPLLVVQVLVLLGPCKKPI